MKLKPQTMLLAAFSCFWSGPITLGAASDIKQSQFDTPEQAVAALQEGVKSADATAMQRLFGPALLEISNPDPADRASHLTAFSKRLAESIELTRQEDRTVILRLGKEKWPFPIPLARNGEKWFFDTEAGKEEILNRRIGGNELSALDVCHSYVKAQREYVQRDYDGSGIMQYAQRMQSAVGKKDGLFWESRPGEAESPFGPLVTKASEEGYDKKSVSATSQKHDPFHGYFFRIVKRQGNSAPGGKYDYVINGHMVAGFAFLAYPAIWGNSGVMTFIVNQQGKIYQRNLGPKTEALAKAIEEYDPDENSGCP